jgi:predicted protein tyrosine phosphatase
MMSRIPTPPKTITINANQPSDEATIKKINAFQRSIKPNERIKVTHSETSITYTRYIEPRSQKASRKLNNFKEAMKSAFASVRDSLSTKNTGASDESTTATSNIKSYQSSKLNLFKTTSISIKKFNASVGSQAIKIPVLKDLQQRHVQKHLGEILTNITPQKIKSSFISYLVSSNDTELNAFLKFVKAQQDRESMNNAVEIKQAINFAKKWQTESNKAEIKKELNLHMSQKTLTALSVVAGQLVKFDSGL